VQCGDQAGCGRYSHAVAVALADGAAAVAGGGGGGGGAAGGGGGGGGGTAAAVTAGPDAADAGVRGLVR